MRLGFFVDAIAASLGQAGRRREHWRQRLLDDDGARTYELLLIYVVPRGLGSSTRAVARICADACVSNNRNCSSQARRSPPLANHSTPSPAGQAHELKKSSPGESATNSGGGRDGVIRKAAIGARIKGAQVFGQCASVSWSEGNLQKPP